MTGMSLCNCAGWAAAARHASAEPEACHVACFLTAVGLPRFDPGPEGEGAGFKTQVQCGFRWSPSGCVALSGLDSGGTFNLTVSERVL